MITDIPYSVNMYILSLCKALGAVVLWTLHYRSAIIIIIINQLQLYVGSFPVKGLIWSTEH